MSTVNRKKGKTASIGFSPTLPLPYLAKRPTIKECCMWCLLFIMHIT